MIEEIKGDLFYTDCDVVGHGVNCRGGFGSGIAGQIKNLFPNVRDEYLKYHENNGWQLGDVQLVKAENKEVIGDKKLIIANCATQINYYPREILNADYSAIETICYKLKDYCKQEELTLALPRIGCGLAGGDWEIVKAIYEKVFDDFHVKVYCI